jgi:hypothetical protein
MAGLHKPPGVELAGELAEMLPDVASRHGLAPDRPAVRLVEAGPTILVGFSQQLIDKATRTLADLGSRSAQSTTEARSRRRTCAAGTLRRLPGTAPASAGTTGR